MTISPRWHKVLADLWGNKTRTFLTALTIAVGLFAVGFVGGMSDVMLPDMNADYRSVNPHSGIVYCDPFDDTLLASLRQVPGVADVEGRSSAAGRVPTGQGNKKVNIALIGLPPLGTMKIDLLRTINPGDSLAVGEREVLLENTVQVTLPSLKKGDLLPVELPDGRIRELRIAGFVRDVTVIPAYLGFDSINAYVSPKTIEWLGGTQDYTQLYFTVTDGKTDKAHIQAVGQALSDKIEKSKRTVYYTFIYNPGRHFAADITQGVAAITGVLGGLSVFLSIFLIVNTVNSLMSQHMRQIGIMKAVGGRSLQITVMYLVLVMGFGLIALIPTVPLSGFISYQVSQGFSSYLNFRLQGFRIPPQTLALQTALALGVPLAAAFFPVLRGTRLTIREAMASYGLGKGRFGKGRLDRLTEKIRFLSRPLLISLRNTIRRKTRLALTLVTLTLGGAIFIGVLNLRTAVDNTLHDIEGYFLADVNINFGRAYRFDKIQSLALTVPGVVAVEGWGYSSGQLLSLDKQSATDLQFIAPRSDSKLIQPIIIAGRWVTPQDENAIVIGPHLLKARPDLKVGESVIIKINNRETEWHIVGVYRIAGNMGLPLVYTNYEYLSRLTGQVGLVGDLRVVTQQHNLAAQKQVQQTMEAMFKQAGVEVSGSNTGVEWKKSQSDQMDMLIQVMLQMAVMIAVVGGLGLMGTMSMNVLERTREIGVMRSIGATNFAIFQMVVVEGMLIGLISWALAIVVSIPITFVLNQGVGVAILTVAMEFAFGWEGVTFWLVTVLGLAALSSLLPAWNAVRLTVREVLAYE
jgi:putative ABC transport system permease protein